MSKMTNEEKRIYIEAIEDALLKKTTPENFSEMRDSLLSCGQLRDAYRWRSECSLPVPEETKNAADEQIQAVEESASTQEVAAQEVDEKEIDKSCAPYVQDEDIPHEEPKAATTHTKDEVKQKLLTLQNKNGVDIAAVMQSLGHAKLSEFDEGEYEDLIRSAEAMVK